MVLCSDPADGIENYGSEVRYYQSKVGLLFPRRTFAKLVWWLQRKYAREDLRWSASALCALQYAAEDALCMNMSMLYPPLHSIPPSPLLEHAKCEKCMCYGLQKTDNHAAVTNLGWMP